LHAYGSFRPQQPAKTMESQERFSTKPLEGSREDC
jgi:hypothetical protein